MAIFTTLSMLIYFSMGALGIFATLVYVFPGGGQNFERRNVERLTF